MAPHDSSTRIGLAVIYSQYDREKHAGALARLISLLSDLESADATVYVVDNARPGSWSHEVSAGLVHLGGDNSCREFSAFEAGLAHIASSDRRHDVYAFATDAFLAYGDEYLELVDDATLRCCLDLGACIGWIDSFGVEVNALGYDYEAWARTSLIFLSAAVLSRLEPLNTPLDEAVLFDRDAATPFAADAPLSQSLRSQLLAWLTTVPTDVSREEPWHSQFDLTDETFDLFKAKVCAILREHLLSARLLHLGVPCYDFRLIRKLVEHGAEPQDGWQWLGWREAEIARTPRFAFEHRALPSSMAHGEAAELALVGWVASHPQPREVLISLGDFDVIGGRCELPRPDVVAAFPEFTDELCGFDVRATLDSLPPGAHEVVWTAGPLKEKLGRIHVLPRCDFHVRRRFVPASAPAGQRLPISLQGTVECSFPLEAVEVLWNGESTGITPDFVEGEPRAGGLRTYDVSLIGDVDFSKPRPQHRLELRFSTADGECHSWRHFEPIKAEETIPHALPSKVLGGFDPRSGLVEVYFKGFVRATGDDDLLFLREDHCLLEAPLAGVAADRRGYAWFELRRKVAGIPPGTWNFGLALGPRHRPRVFARWRAQVPLLEPQVTLEYLDVRPPDEIEPKYILGIAGWVENHFVIERLLLTLDDEDVATLAIDEMRDDVAEHFGQTLVRRQGFKAEIRLDLPPEEYVLRLSASQPGGRATLLEKTVVFGEPPASGLLLRSAVLEDLDGEKECEFSSSIAVEGDLLADLEDVDVKATLYVDNEVTDQLTLAPGDHFALRHVPEDSGTYPVRVRFDARGHTVYDSGIKNVSFQRVDIPPDLPDVLEKFVERFQLTGLLGLGSSESILRTWLERDAEGLSDHLEMIREIGSVLDSKPHGGSEAPLPHVDRPLKILMPSWEVPCLRNGGGVWMTNVLRSLSGKHEITLIHSYGDDEEDWVDDVRPYLHKVISIPRTHQPIPAWEDRRVLGHLYSEYIASLRAAVESEVFTGKYDVVDYQYVKMFPHRSRADVPQVLTVFEELFTARLANYSHQGASDAAKVEQLDRLLKAFYFSAVVLPGAFRHLIAVTDEDARVMSDFQNGTQVHVNGIGIDTEKFAPPAGEDGEEPGNLVFLGNYRHPPSVDAVVYVAENVMPEVWRRHPETEFHIIGAYPPEEVEELGKADRITVTGFVDDVRPLLWRAAAFVAPIFTGSGMRVKILEAMACGAPVIATRLSMHGVEAVDGRHYFRAENASQFIEACCRVIGAPEKAADVGRAGRELMNEQYSLEVKSRQREAIWHQVIADWKAGRE